MNNIVVLSAGKTLKNDLYPFFTNEKKNQFITNYRKKTFIKFDNIFEILGYSQKKIFSKSQIFHNSNWMNERSCGSFLKFIKKYSNEDLFACYSDIIFNQTAIENILNNKKDLSFHINILEKENEQTTEKIKLKNKKFEFSGLVYFNKKVIKYLNLNSNHLYEKFKKKNLSYLISYLIKKFEFNYFLDENVKECNEYSDYLNFLFFSKGHALQNFVFKDVKINKFVNFTFNEWKSDKDQIIDNIKNNLKKKLIVRSSSSKEDKLNYSNAGKYLSLPNVNNSKKSLVAAINKVFKSYENINHKDFIIVQNMQLNYLSSGVIFSRDLEISSPYFIINEVNKKHGDTSSVTSGKSNNEKKTIILKQKNLVPLKYRKLVKFLKYVESLTGIQSLDCEFALTKKETIIFQIRPLLSKGYDLDKKINYNLSREYNNLKKNFQNKKLLLSVMTDWNPAEIIGKNSFPLSIFVYKYLILDLNWYLQRSVNGYWRLKDKKLSYKIGNTLYIDVIKSFKSFIPDNLNDKIKNKLLNQYYTILNKDTSLHDKIESNIVISNLSPKFRKKINSFNLSLKEKNIFEFQLKKINIKIIDLVNKNFKNLKKLNLESIKLNEKFNKSNNISDIFKILKITKKNFILPFAHLARGGFVSKYILDDIFDTNKVNKILSNIETISSELRKDLKKLNKRIFFKKYKHLVPNTYNFENVLNKNNFFNNINKKSNKEKKFNFKKSLKNQLDSETLLSLGFKNKEQFIDFIEFSIKGREYAKFIFTRNIYLIFTILKNWSLKNNISPLEINFIDKSILNLIQKKFNKKRFFNSINRNKLKFEINSKFNLPDIINSTKNIFYHEELNSQPTYIGKNIVSDLINYTKNKIDSNIYKNKIVLIPNADPGFEFLFHLGIKGIITKYGGSNSHMAIRSNELGLTSIIGMGNKFDKIKICKKIKIYSINKKFEIIK